MFVPFVAFHSNQLYQVKKQKTKMAEKTEVKVVIVPGNGAGDVTRCNWYGWLQDKLTKAGEYNPYRLLTGGPVCLHGGFFSWLREV